MSIPLTTDQLSCLYAWLSAHNISTTKINREFSDATALAQLLKKFYPKLVDLHNYTPFCSVKLKLNNWEVLNAKVLTKLGLAQSKKFLEQLAQAEGGAIECLLYALMMHEDTEWRRRNNIVNISGDLLHVGDGVFVVPISRDTDQTPVDKPQKMILYSKYENAIRASDLSTRAMHEAQQRVVHLENLLAMKTERLTEIYHELSQSLLVLETARKAGFHLDLDLCALKDLYRLLRE